MWFTLLQFLLFILPFSFALNPFPDMDLSVVRLMAPIVFLFWALDSLKQKRFFIDRRFRFWFFLLFLFLCCLSIVWAIDQTRAIKKILFLLPFLSLYLPVYDATCQTKNHLPLIKALFYGALISACFGLVQFFLQFFLDLEPTLKLLSKTIVPFFQGENFAKLILEYPSWLVNINGKTVLRAFGSFPDPHLFSLYLNLCLPAAFWLYLKEKRAFYLLGATLIFFGSLLSFSRAAYLSLAGAALFLLFFSSLKTTLLKKPAFMIVLAVLIISMFLTSNPISNRFYDSFNLKEGSNSGRLLMWQKAYQIFLDHPLTGVGLGNFSRSVEPQSTQRNPIYAHNLLLDFASETGLLSTLFLLTALLSPIISFFLHKNALSKSVATSFVILLIHSLFETPFYSVNVFPLIITLLALNPLSYEKNPPTAAL